MGARKVYIALMTGLLLCFSTFAYGRDFQIPPEKLNKVSGQFKTCSAIKSRGIRLLCFDQISIELGLRTIEQQQQTEEILGKFGLWEGTKIDGEFGDQKFYYKLMPDIPISERASLISQPEFVILCQYQSTRAYLDWKDSLSSTADPKKTIMEYRIGSPRPFVEHWDLSTDSYAAFSPEPIELLKALKGKNKLQMRFTTKRTGVQTLLFSLEGIEAVMDSIVENCYQ